MHAKIVAPQPTTLKIDLIIKLHTQSKSSQHVICRVYLLQQICRAAFYWGLASIWSVTHHLHTLVECCRNGCSSGLCSTEQCWMSVIVTFGFLVYGNCSNLLGGKLWEECHGPHVFLAVSHWLPFLFLFFSSSMPLLHSSLSGPSSLQVLALGPHTCVSVTTCCWPGRFPQLLFKAVAQSSSPLERWISWVWALSFIWDLPLYIRLTIVFCV